MAFKTYDNDGKCSIWSGTPTAALVESDTDVRDIHDDPWPGSKRDRLVMGIDPRHDKAGEKIGAAQRAKDAGTWPSKALKEASAKADAKYPPYPAAPERAKPAAKPTAKPAEGA